jgi:hypothetical protein
MKYSIAEIDRMRFLLRRISVLRVGYSNDGTDREVEDRLRTLMLNGTEVVELERELESREAAQRHPVRERTNCWPQ